jgi:hypothetical protein
MGLPVLWWFLFLLVGMCCGCCICWCCRRRLYAYLATDELTLLNEALGRNENKPLLGADANVGVGADGYGAANADVNVNLAGGGGSGAGAGADVNVVIDMSKMQQQQQGSSVPWWAPWGSPAAAAAAGAYPPPDGKAVRTYAAGPDVRTENVAVDATRPPPAPPASQRGSGARLRERATGPDTPGLTVSGTLPGGDDGCCVPKRKPQASRWGR